MNDKKVHYHYVGRDVELRMLCRVPPRVPVAYLPGHRSQSSMDPAQVTCRRCLLRMVRLTHEYGAVPERTGAG